MSAIIDRIDRSEAADYYFTYIDQVTLVPGQSIVRVLEAQREEMIRVCATFDEAGAGHRYAPGKWSLRQVLSHINDTERVFAGRALWFARALPEALPSYDQDVAMAEAGADDRTWRSHVEEFEAVRAASIALFRHLPDAAWTRTGVASGNRFSVRALAVITAGHVAHHLGLIRARYGAPGSAGSR